MYFFFFFSVEIPIHFQNCPGLGLWWTGDPVLANDFFFYRDLHFISFMQYGYSTLTKRDKKQTDMSDKLIPFYVISCGDTIW